MTSREEWDMTRKGAMFGVVGGRCEQFRKKEYVRGSGVYPLPGDVVKCGRMTRRLAEVNGRMQWKCKGCMDEREVEEYKHLVEVSRG